MNEEKKSTNTENLFKNYENKNFTYFYKEDNNSHLKSIYNQKKSVNPDDFNEIIKLYTSLTNEGINFSLGGTTVNHTFTYINKD